MENTFTSSSGQAQVLTRESLPTMPNLFFLDLASQNYVLGKGSLSKGGLSGLSIVLLALIIGVVIGLPAIGFANSGQSTTAFMVLAIGIAVIMLILLLVYRNQTQAFLGENVVLLQGTITRVWARERTPFASFMV